MHSRLPWGESFWDLLCRLMGFLSILFSTCGHLSVEYEASEFRKKELQGASPCRSPDMWCILNILQRREGGMFNAASRDFARCQAWECPPQRTGRNWISEQLEGGFCVDIS